VSVGVATLRPGEDTRALIQRADAAMYAAKSAGRNRVVQAGEG
jgi:diguanylate cyclase